jgi:uncharacterized protein
VVTTLDDLRRFASARSLFPPATLKDALQRLGFVQADPIRAPARAQDLTLRHRVRDYRAGDLERQYAALGVEEDIFINYGFVTRELQALMHPRTVPANWSHVRRNRAREQAILAFVRERGPVHPRDVLEKFSHGTVVNYWGGSSNATTFVLEDLHYRGHLRVVRRDAGIRVYAVREHGPPPTDAAGRQARIDALVDVVVRLYAPLPAASLAWVINRLRYATPHWRSQLPRAKVRARERLSHVRVDGVSWYWPANEPVEPFDAAQGRPGEPPDTVRLLAPFDPVIWDRRRFEMLWGWRYRFEAYTPLSKRKWGYYALPLLWRDRVIGWGNVSVKNGVLSAELGYVQSRPPRDRFFKIELEAELERMRAFLSSQSAPARFLT